MHIVHVDPDRAAAAGKALFVMFLVWLASHLLPMGLELLDGWLGGWLGTLWHVVSFPFVLAGSLVRAIASAVGWTVSAVDSAFHIAAMVQAVLFPVCAALAGCCIGRDDVWKGALPWMWATGLNAICAVLLGYPLLAGMLVVGSLAAFAAAVALKLSPRSPVGWLAAAMVGGLMVWGSERYGTSFKPVCWLLVALAWCALAFGAAYGLRRKAGGGRRVREATSLLLLASALATVAVGPFAADAARASGLLADMPPTSPVAPLPAVAGPAPVKHEDAVTALPVRSPAPAVAPHRIR